MFCQKFSYRSCSVAGYVVMIPGDLPSMSFLFEHVDPTVKLRQEGHPAKNNAKSSVRISPVATLHE